MTAKSRRSPKDRTFSWSSGSLTATRAFVALGLVALGVLAVAAPSSGDNTKRQTAVATGGWLAIGANGGYKDPRGGTFRFKAVLGYPDGTIEGNGPQRPDDADLRKPWVSLTESSTDASGNNRTECVSFTNPTSASFRNTTIGEVPDVFVDVSCDDRRGYDFYRLRWKGTEPLNFGPERSRLPLGPFQRWWGPDYAYNRPFYGGGAEWTTFRTHGSSLASFSVCGYRHGQADCLIPEGQTEPWRIAYIDGGWTSIAFRSAWAERSTCC